MPKLLSKVANDRDVRIFIFHKVEDVQAEKYGRSKS